MYFNTFDAEDSNNMWQDIQILENNVREDQELIKHYWNMIEHFEVLCNAKGNNDTKY